ncbi:CopG family transcriptional regulator [Candidatus Bathyarchaeota archaeon]|nr:CopG family transcriptional regulator [Candidatus Bathyarchaeota archaeon]
MNKIVAVKVSNEVKEKMDKLKDKVNWPKELRNFIEERIRIEEAEENIKKVIAMIETTKPVPKGFSSLSVREDRDSG